jgi:hypothetical protein
VFKKDANHDSVSLSPFHLLCFFSRGQKMHFKLRSDGLNAIMLQSKPRSALCLLFEFELKIHHHHCQQQRDPL